MQKSNRNWTNQMQPLQSIPANKLSLLRQSHFFWRLLSKLQQSTHNRLPKMQNGAAANWREMHKMRQTLNFERGR
jgi:hypothetical protein